MITFALFTVCFQLVNAFASQIDPEVKAKVIYRLQKITELQNQLPKYLAGKRNKIIVLWYCNKNEGIKMTIIVW